MSELKIVDEDSFDSEVLKHESLVVVDFSAEWCGPCKKQLPVLENFASENPALKIVKIDIDESPSLASKYGIRSIPSLVFFNNGKIVNMRMGLINSSALKTLVDNLNPIPDSEVK